jgi:hypothetical protein
VFNGGSLPTEGKKERELELMYYNRKEWSFGDQKEIKRCTGE